jgi:hypothetical protein
MTLCRLIVTAACVLCSVGARAQDPALHDAITAQQHRGAVLTDADLARRLDGKLMEIARDYWMSAKADGLKFENVVENIDRRNASMAEFGLPLQIIRRDPSDEFAITERSGETTRRAWVSLSGTSPDTGIDLAAIDGALMTHDAVEPSGGIALACRYRVVFAEAGEHDERGRDDYAKAYPCIDFLTGQLDPVVIEDLKRWSADLVRRTAQ